MSFSNLWSEHEILLDLTVSVVSNCIYHLPGVSSALQVTTVDFVKLFLLETETNTRCLLESINSQLSLDLTLTFSGYIVNCLTMSNEPNINFPFLRVWHLCDFLVLNFRFYLRFSFWSRFLHHFDNIKSVNK